MLVMRRRCRLSIRPRRCSARSNLGGFLYSFFLGDGIVHTPSPRLVQVTGEIMLNSGDPTASAAPRRSRSPARGSRRSIGRAADGGDLRKLKITRGRGYLRRRVTPTCRYWVATRPCRTWIAIRRTPRRRRPGRSRSRSSLCSTGDSLCSRSTPSS